VRSRRRAGGRTELSPNGSPLFTVEGGDVGRVCFSIWLGENPLDKVFMADPWRGLPLFVGRG